MSAIYQLKIELEDSQPSIWRRVQVSSNTSFSDFGDIIDIAFQRQSDSGEFEFIINKVRIIDFGPAIDNGQNPELRDCMDTFLDEFLNLTGIQFSYYSELDDQIRYAIVLEKIYPDGEKLEQPRCISGERASPHIDSGLFDIDEVNHNLQQYSEEWDKIHNNLSLEEENPSENIHEEYEYLKHFIQPEDLLKDKKEKSEIENWLKDFLNVKNSIEFKHYKRLIDQGYDRHEAKSLVLECVAIEWFYEIKYATIHIDERYTGNLERLPEKPVELPNLKCAIQVLETSYKGIPFSAIEYLHDDNSPEATEAIVHALQNYIDHQYCWGNCEMAPVWYAIAAEGHLHEAMIDLVIGLCKSNDNESDWLLEQAEVLIGKLAMKYPDLTAAKVLDALEKDAKEGTNNSLFFLFDCFYFCELSLHKERLLSLLRNTNDIFWQEPLVSTLSFLQVKEALPILKQRLAAMQKKEPSKNHIEYIEAIAELESGELRHRDIRLPICLRRKGTLREEWEPIENAFYPDGYTYDPEEAGFIDELEEEQSIDWTYNQSIKSGKKIGRNDPCPCGSGKKYKKCCLGKEE